MFFKEIIITFLKYSYKHAMFIIFNVRLKAQLIGHWSTFFKNSFVRAFHSISPLKDFMIKNIGQFIF